jgi:hypothetical protein
MLIAGLVPEGNSLVRKIGEFQALSGNPVSKPGTNEFLFDSTLLTIYR